MTTSEESERNKIINSLFAQRLFDNKGRVDYGILADFILAELAKARIDELKLAETNNQFRNQEGLPMFIRHEEYIKDRLAELSKERGK